MVHRPKIRFLDIKPEKNSSQFYISDEIF